MSDYEILYAQQEAAARRAQNAENGTRAATFVSTHLSSGDGEYIQNQPTVFDCAFVGKPIVSHGSELVQRPNKALFQLPRVSCGVFKWVFQQTAAETIYTGAYLYFTVDIPYLVGVSSSAAPVSQVLHHVSFNGIAMKQLTQDILGAADLL